LPETLIEGELFGHVKGAYSGAIYDRVGRIEEADGGTLFLDEIGETSSEIQVKLLRVLQEKSFERIGNNRTIHADVRIIAATNRELKSEIERGRFRIDLWYRLSVVQIYVPPLRERKEDILLLAEHFLRKLGGFKRISPGAMECLVNYNWPGNVRELGNILERAGVIGEEEELLPEYLPQEIQNAPERARWPSDSSIDRRWMKSLPDLNLHRLESALIQEALRRTEGNKTKAAALLGVHRRTLYNR
jgi:transcriptional regulator with GAF, ATPase, and Fis domain